MTRSKNIHVVPRNDGWVIRREGASRATSTHETQTAAITAARELARSQGSELVIHGRDGRIRDRDSYGTDPLPPKERRVLFPDKTPSINRKVIKEAVAAVVREKKLSSDPSLPSSER